MLYWLATHRGCIELSLRLYRHGGGHIGGAWIRMHHGGTPTVRLRTVCIAARGRLRLERRRHRISSLAVTIPERVLGRISSRRVMGVVRRIVGVESTSSATAMVEATTVGAGHSLVAHVSCAGHGNI